MRSTLTETAVKAAHPNATLWDGSLKHFGLRVAPGGTKSFLVLLGSGRRQTIGRYPAITLAQARLKARRILAERTLGRHQIVSLTWQNAVQKFIEARRAAARPRTVGEYERSLKCYFPFGTMQLSEIARVNISGKLEKLNKTPSQKAHALVIVKMLFRWAIVEGFIDVDPTAAFKRARQRKRARVLSDCELQSIWRACEKCRATREESEPFSDLPAAMPRVFAAVVQLLLLMGQRRGETAAMRRSWWSDDTITLPAEITKNKRVHTFPIGPVAQSIFATFDRDSEDFIFPARGRAKRPFSGWSKGKIALDRLCGVTNWRLHDLRRTFRTIHGRIGTPPHVAERIINHVNAIASDVEQTYDMYTYLPQMREAMQRYETELRLILHIEPRNAAA
jgi:integrase